MDVNDRTNLANALFSEVRKLFNKLGFDIKMERVTKKAPEESDA
jgi:hypothetical protein